MSKVKKAGCILINTIEHTIALVRRKENEYSFPKGHLEEYLYEQELKLIKRKSE